MQTNHIIGALIISGILILGAFVLASGGKSDETSTDALAFMEGDTQVIEIIARGGYTPQVTKAKAGVPTIIRMKTENTYDCSSALVIPSLGYQKNLKPSAVEEIEVPLEKTQGILKGMCSMAMYHFQIVFE
jgi:plastocyanin domain-containing protein